MALILLGKSECPLCGGVLREGDELVGTSHFIGDPADPLYRYSDAGMHKECFLHWDLRSDFVSRYNSLHRSNVWGNGTYFQMGDDGTIRLIQARPE
jgi:hypothetical protein